MPRLGLPRSHKIWATSIACRSFLNQSSRRSVTNESPIMADSQLYEDSFTITAINSQKYDRVSRLTGTSSDSLTVCSLDVNTELYPVNVNDPFQLMLASTLNLDGTKDERGWRPTAQGESTLADMWDYVCYGKVYRFEEGEGDNMYGCCARGFGRWKC